MVEKEIIGLLPPGTYYTFHETSVAEAEVERSSKPETIALGVFGGIAGIAALVIAGLAIGRAISGPGDELDALRGLGADPRTLTWDATFGLLGAIVLGALSPSGSRSCSRPWLRSGRRSQIDPSPGFAADWTVFATGWPR